MPKILFVIWQFFGRRVTNLVSKHFMFNSCMENKSKFIYINWLALINWLILTKWFLKIGLFVFVKIFRSIAMLILPLCIHLCYVCLGIWGEIMFVFLQSTRREWFRLMLYCANALANKFDSGIWLCNWWIWKLILQLMYDCKKYHCIVCL